MNTIQEKIKKAHLESRKAKNTTLSNILGCLLGEVSIVGKNNGNRETNDSEAIIVIKKFKKDTIFTRDKISDRDKQAELDYEINVYEEFLPTQMNKEKLATIISTFIKSEENPNIGSVMKYLNSNFKGLFDGKEASNIIRGLV